MQKELALQFQKEKFLSLRSISNYTHTVIQRLSQCLPSPESPEFLNCCSLPRSSKEVISHSASLLLSPQFSLSDAPFLGAPRRWSVSSFTHWGRNWLGTGPGTLPDPVAIPGELVCPSNESGWGSAIWRIRTLVWKRTQITIRWCASSFISDPSAPTQQSHQSGGSRSQHGWNLAGASRNVAETSTGETKPNTWKVGELRFIMPVGPEELTLQALSPKQRGYRDFIHAGMIKQVCKEQDKGEWDKLQFPVLWVPTFWELRDLDFARGKLSYRGRRRRWH